MVHRNAGVHTRFLVVHTPQELQFALVWGEFQHKVVRHFRQDFVISPRSFVRKVGKGDRIIGKN